MSSTTFPGGYQVFTKAGDAVKAGDPPPFTYSEIADLALVVKELNQLPQEPTGRVGKAKTLLLEVLRDGFAAIAQTTRVDD